MTDETDGLPDAAPTPKLSHLELKRAARLAAIQALYQMDLTQKPSKSVVFEFLNHRFGHEDEPGYTQADEKLFETVVQGVVANQKSIDEAVSRHLSERWKLSRLDRTLRAILRCGAFELMHKPGTAAPVIIDQYVGLARAFHDVKPVGFANAVLDKLARDVRSAEMTPTNAK